MILSIPPIAGGASGGIAEWIRRAATAVNSLISGKQDADGTLTALAGLDATAGLVEQTGADTFTKRALGVGASTSVLTRADGDGRYALVASAGVSSFNTRTGAVTLTSGDVTTALTYTPTSVAGLTGAQSVAAFKTGLSLVKGDVGLASVDNTADAAKNVLTATKLLTARTIAMSGDVVWSTSFDGSGNVTAAGTIQAGAVTLAKMANLAANSFIGNNTGSAATPLALTPAQAKTLLAIAASDVSGLAAIATSGSATDLTTGTVPAARLPAFTGDATTVAGAVALTLATVNANTGSFGSATQSLTLTANGKGLITALSAQTVTPAVGSITGLGTGVATALAVNVGSAGAFVAFNGALGTPSSGTLTNCTFPTLNQNTTGSAAKWTTARNLAGNSVDGSANVAFANKFIVQGTADTGLSAAQFLGALGTGIVKNTTTTGVLSIAVAGDFPTLNQSTTGSAATLTTARTIAGNSFDGSANISINDTDLSGSAWTAYTPAITADSGAYTTVSATGRSKAIGKTVFVEVVVTITTAGTAAGLYASLPAAASAFPFILMGRETAATGSMVQGNILASGSVMRITKYDDTAINQSGRTIVISGVYEKA